MSNDEQYECIYCYKLKPGRFTRRKSASGGGWSQGFTQPAWACFDCLPFGQGKNEEPMAPTVIITPKAAELVKAKKEGLSILNPLRADVDSLSIQTAEDYIVADDLLTRVRGARKTWTSKLAPIMDPLSGALKLAKQAMEGAKALYKEVDDPLDRYETAIRGKMRDYKLLEQQQLREAAQAKDDEQRRIQAEIDEKQRRIDATKTKAIRERLEREQAVLETQQIEVQAEPEVTAVKVANSGTRSSKKPRVSDMDAFFKGLGDGYIPHDCVSISQGKLNAYYKDDPEGMAAWPGVTIEDDITIVGR